MGEDRRHERERAADTGVRIVPVTASHDLRHAFEIRRRVFVEGQDCPEDEEFDGLDDTSHHVLAWVGGQPVATARWREVAWGGEDGEGDTRAAKLERFAVLESRRGLGLGRTLVERLIADSEAAGIGTAVLHAQAHLERFYAGFGFRTEGEGFVEAGIPHVRMVRRSPSAGGPPAAGD